jgi:hypothetical protein
MRYLALALTLSFALPVLAPAASSPAVHVQKVKAKKYKYKAHKAPKHKAVHSRSRAN